MIVEWLYIAVCAAVDIAVAVMLARMLFPEPGDFTDAIVFWVTPDMWSMMTGHFWDDMWAEMKLSMLLLLVGGLCYGEMYLGTNQFELDLSFGNDFIATLF